MIIASPKPIDKTPRPAPTPSPLTPAVQLRLAVADANARYRAGLPVTDQHISRLVRLGQAVIGGR
jgi:hypothetical protein